MVFKSGLPTQYCASDFYLSNIRHVMNLSLFPKGKYYVKKVSIKYRNSYPENNPFAILIENGPDNSVCIWDVNSFRPDPRLDSYTNKLICKGVEVIILYESLNFLNSGCYKIPRYIFIGDKENGKWIINVR